MQLNIKNKTKQPNQKIGRSKQTFLQRRHTDGQKSHEKMPNITIREMRIKTTMRYHLTIVKMAFIKKVCKQYILKRVWRKGNPPALLVGIKIDAASMENNMEGPQKTKNRVAIMIQ